MNAASNLFHPRRRTVQGHTRVEVDRLSPGCRETMIDACFAVYRENSRSLDRAEFGRRFFAPGTKVALFHGDGELAGFSNARVLEVKAGRRTHRVFSAGVYFRLRYRGGGRQAVRFGFAEALREKLRRPHLPLAYLCMASNPAVYRLHRQLANRVWPLPGGAPPPELAAAVKAVCDARGLEPVEGDLWRVRSFVRPDHPERLRRSAQLRRCPDARFFDARNPDWADPERPTALLLWVPLDLQDIAIGLQRTMQHVARRGAPVLPFRTPLRAAPPAPARARAA